MSDRTRRERLQGAMEAAKLKALLVTHLPDVRWLSGFTGSNAAVGVVVSKRELQCRLFTDGRYTAQAKQEVKRMPVTIAQKPVAAETTAWMEQQRVSQSGFDAATMPVAALESLRKSLPARVRRGFFADASGIVSRLREVKDADEIRKLRAAAYLGCALYEQMLGFIEHGQTETEVAAELEYRARRMGAEAMSFETIVASGNRSSLPHGKASQKRLAAGDLITLDFGVILDGYCSDMTRTVYLSEGKKVTKRFQEQHRVYHAVLEAQEAAVAAVKAGVACSAVDEAARSVLRAAGLEKEFSHSTGHGVGLEIHEGPRVAAKSTETLQAGMVVTIEPGAYLPGKFGVRIEDTVLVTKTGAEILTPATKAWTEL